MRTLMRLSVVYGAVLGLMLVLAALMDGCFTLVSLFVTPAVVSSLFLVTAFSGNEE